MAQFAPMLLAGLILWDYISIAAKSGCHCFFQGEAYIRQHPAPIAIYPLRTALGERGWNRYQERFHNRHIEGRFLDAVQCVLSA